MLALVPVLQSCREDSRNGNNEIEITGEENLDISLNQVNFYNWTQNNISADPSVEIELSIKNNSTYPVTFNFTGSATRAEGEFNARLKKPDELADLFLVDRQKLKEKLQPNDSIRLDLRIMRGWKGNNLEEMLNEFNSEFSGKYTIYLINLTDNTYSREVDFDRLERSFYLNSERVQRQDTLRMRKSG
jgi:hypothetical protein